MSFEPLDYIRHILAELEYLMNASQGLEREEFLEDPTLRRAFVRSLEIVGEATKNLPSDLRTQHEYIEWRSMAGMRDRLIHGYFGVDYGLVWEVVQTKVPALRKQLRELLKSSHQ